MFHSRSVSKVILLIVLTQTSVFASVRDVKILAKPYFKAITNSMSNAGIDGIVSGLRSRGDSCAEDIAVIIDALQAQEMWAMQMLDASSKIQPGFLKGNLQNLGMFDECVEVNGNYNGTNIKGKYCRVWSGTASSAVCVPSSCNETQVAELINIAKRFMTKMVEVDFEVDGVSCVPPKPADLTFLEIGTTLFFSAVCAFIFFCTFCEYIEKYRPENGSPVLHVLTKFSLLTNAKILFSTEVSPRIPPAIQGIRFISMCFVVYAHHVLFMVFQRPVNYLDFVEWIGSWSALPGEMSTFAVDTFFVISGFLMAESFLKKRQSGKNINYLMMYVHRYFRITPCVVVLLLFVTVFYQRFVYGPIWNETMNDQFIETCEKNWWVDLLYIQNLLNKNKWCLHHLWFLAVDMQLFWISPIILYPLHRWPKFGLRILCFLLIASVVTPAVIVSEYGYKNAIINFDVPLHDIITGVQNYYTQTYNRATAFFIGILLGYDISKKKRSLTRINVTVNWIVACLFILICGLTTHRLYDSAISYDAIFESAYGGLSRFVWSIAIAWIIYACIFDYGGPITRFLSLPIFLPLSRLSYCIYLVHPVIQGMKISMIQTPETFSHFTVLKKSFGDIIISIPPAIILNLFIESPVMILLKMLTSREPHRSVTREEKTDVEGDCNNTMSIEA